jgi:ATP-dependent Clp protease ATP-binding subunit ClpC
MNRYFFLWYYTRGLQAAFLVWGNILRAVLHRFHTMGLLLTLFSPWKRDVAVRDWLGFHPMKSLERLFENFISRFLGMMVRIVMIIFGIGVLIFSVIVGLTCVGLYLLAPLFLVLGILLLPVSGTALSFLIAGAVGLLLALLGYLLRVQDEEYTTDITLLKQRPWFGRLLGRLGLKKEEVSGVMGSTEAFLQLLLTRGIAKEVYEQAVAIEYTAAQKRVASKQFFSWENLHKGMPLGKGWKYAYTPHLDRYAIDLSQFDPTEYRDAILVGRAEELKLTTLVLGRPMQNSVLLVGEPGVGKQILIHHLARLIRQNVFEGTSLGDTRFLLLDIGRVVSDAANQQMDVPGFVRRLFGEAAYAGNVVVVIENIDTVLGKGGHENLAPVLGEFLALPGFRLIATMSKNRYHVIAPDNESLFKFFETIHFHETNEEETLQVLLDFVRPFEKKNIIFTLPGLLSLISQASRYKWEVPFPERALDLAQEVLTYWQGEGKESFITPAVVEAFVTLKTGMPTGAIGTEEKDKLLSLEQHLHERVIGQEEAVKQVAEAMRRARAGFGDGRRPLGSFLFLGPTGVGKTETVKAFAESYFGSEDQMIRLDMSEFQTPEAVDRLIGSEASGMSGQLTDMVKEKPFSILLLDELEKAYPKALDLFLQILDEGFVTNSAGEKVSFRNTIIIATSNAGATLIKEGIAQGTPFAEVRKQVLDFVVEQGIYRMEFLNRFDGVIFFEPLKDEELLRVTNLKLESFAKRLKKEKNISITFASGVAEKIVVKGYEPEFGARSINRYIEDTIEDAVINQIIAGSVTTGGTLAVTADDLPV